MSVYLDYNASAPIHSEVIDEMIQVYKNVIGNADSRTHDFGANANKVVANARKKVADLFGVRSDEVFFTSGATESDNIAIQGLKRYGIKNNKRHIITTSIEHKAVLETVKSLESEGFEIQIINPMSNGRVDANQVIASIREDTLLVTVMHVNNETGIIQPVKEIGDYLKDKPTFFHIDATQSSGKLVEEIQNLNYDMLSVSAHKMEGPQGIGALILKKKNYRLPPVESVYFGGSQEHGIRPGTTPVALVAGFGKSCELALSHYKENEEKAIKIKKGIVEAIKESGIPIALKT